MTAPKRAAELRPISINCIPTIYDHRKKSPKAPSFCRPPTFDKIAEQFAFRSTGSTIDALIAILHDVSELLITYNYATYNPDLFRLLQGIWFATSLHTSAQTIPAWLIRLDL